MNANRWLEHVSAGRGLTQYQAASAESGAAMPTLCLEWQREEPRWNRSGVS